MEDYHYSNTIHPTAIIGPHVEMGENNYIGPFCIIGMPAEHKDYWPKQHTCYFTRLDEEMFGRVIIGNGNVFTGHVTIDAGTEGNAKATIIQNNTWMLKHSHIGHDAIVCDGVVVSCGAKIGGHAFLGKGVNIGLNACIHQRQKIREGCIIGMGGIVTKKLITEPYKKYAGNPAKLIGDNDQHPDYTIYMKEYPKL